MMQFFIYKKKKKPLRVFLEYTKGKLTMLAQTNGSFPLLRPLALLAAGIDGTLPLYDGINGGSSAPGHAEGLHVGRRLTYVHGPHQHAEEHL